MRGRRRDALVDPLDGYGNCCRSDLALVKRSATKRNRLYVANFDSRD